jgi:hypothetical protein
MITDLPTISKINLDIDLEFHSYTRSYDFDDLRAKIREVFPVADKKVWVRKSANGNTHIRIESSCEFSLFETFLIRAYLGDDSSRISHDLARYWQFRDIGLIGRLFDEKLIKGSVVRAGDWEVLEV